MRSCWHARCGCLNDQMYKTRLENHVHKDNELHRLPEMCAQLAKMYMQLKEGCMMLATAVKDMVRL